MDNPALLAGGAAALLALGGLGVMAARRRKGGKPEKKKIAEIAGTVADSGEAATAEAAAPSAEAGAFAQTAAAAVATTPQAEDVDPISEAELFLNFGRDAQAEEILKDALAEKAMQLRMELIPYIYTLACDSSQSGIPICRSNCLQNPRWEEGYEEWTSYYLGDRIYASPIVNPGTMRSVLLPPGEWYSAITGDLIQSDGRTPLREVASVWKDYPLIITKPAL